MAQILRFPGYSRLLRLGDLIRRADGSAVVDADDYRAWYRDGIAAAGVASWPAGRAPARVNHGRWIVECGCGNGLLVEMTSREALCIRCGAIWEAVLPPNWREIERVLCRRWQREAQNWSPGESIDLLRAENIEHGVEA